LSAAVMSKPKLSDPPLCAPTGAPLTQTIAE
jgi:hypothetical protein